MIQPEPIASGDYLNRRLNTTPISLPVLVIDHLSKKHDVRYNVSWGELADNGHYNVGPQTSVGLFINSRHIGNVTQKAVNITIAHKCYPEDPKFLKNVSELVNIKMDEEQFYINSGVYIASGQIGYGGWVSGAICS